MPHSCWFPSLCVRHSIGHSISHFLRLHPSISHTGSSPRCTLHTSIRSAAITLTHKAAHQWVSGRRLPWQHILSHVAAWSEVRCNWTSPLSVLRCCLYAAIWKKMVQSTQTRTHTHHPQRLCYLVGCRTNLFVTKIFPFLQILRSISILLSS